MTETGATRLAMLSRIRGGREATAPEIAATAYAAIPRDYLRAGSLGVEQRIAMFEERLLEYDARIHRVAETTLPRAMAAAIRDRGAAKMAVPRGLPPEWLPEEIAFTEADRLTNLELNEFDGVVSGCAAAIALTGTIILQNVSGQGPHVSGQGPHVSGQGPRKLSLAPDYHLCVVFAKQIVETVSEAFDRLAATATLPTTLVSGPSATADIEMTRIKGVHGPRFLDVLIVC